MFNDLKLSLLYLSLLTAMACQHTSFDVSDPNTYPIYKGSDLGVSFSPQQTIFKLWAPTAQKVNLKLYTAGLGDNHEQTMPFQLGEHGVWQLKVDADLNHKFYTYQVMVGSVWLNETPGPYAKAVGINGQRGAILDLSATNPEGWEKDKSPELKSFTDIIIYETHIRDFSVHPNSGISNKGKFLAFNETGTTTFSGQSSGIDYLKELGITHLHILPAFDFRSIDETTLDKNDYNWGYDPQNYNVPEGSYATNPYQPEVRIKEFKQMVQALHKSGIRIVLDVVYNHVGDVQQQSFEQTVPGYYFRKDSLGNFSNASGCGNETASERPMMRKFIIESVKYWAQEYHIDGFRFDLMGVHDIETMNQLYNELHQIDSTIFIYGEGWTAGASSLSESKRAVKNNIGQIPGVAVFCDEMRDGIKGHWGNLKAKGFISGEPGMEESVKYGIVAATQHPQIDYKRVNYSKKAWANEPVQTINYVSCHDNNTLWDKLLLSQSGTSEVDRMRMAKLANTIVLTSQGIPFLHSGAEFYRTKLKVENSYNANDSINWLNWNRRDQYSNLVDFYKGLIQMRKDYGAFRLATHTDIVNNLEFFKMPPGLIGYTIKNSGREKNWQSIVVIFNSNKTAANFYLDEDNWKQIFDINTGYCPAGIRVKGNIVIAPLSAYVFCRK